MDIQIGGPHPPKKQKYIFELMNGAEYVSDEVMIDGCSDDYKGIGLAFTADVVRIVTKVGGCVVRFRGSEIRTITEG